MSFDIASTTNDRIKRLVRLRDRKARDTEGVFVVEGEREVVRAISAGIRLLELYGETMDLPETGASRFTVAPAAMKRVSYRASPDAVIGVFEQFDTTISRIVPGSLPLVLMAEGLEKPGNLGAILRTASAFGADAVIAVDSTVDPFNPNVVRSSTGALFSVPVAVATLPETASWLQSAGISVVAGTPDAAPEPWDVDLTGPLALLVGSEDRGLTPEATALASEVVRIPMTGVVDSLNTSVSMALLAYEAVRQRAR